MATLLLPNRLSLFVFPLVWFLFVGLRDGIGTDYYGTLLAVERGQINIEDPWSSFVGYNLVDSELVYKLISTFLFYSEIDIIYFHVLLAALEAFIIFALLRKAYHKKLLICYFMCLFTLHFPMNAQRQGFSLLILVYALNCLTEGSLQRRLWIFLSMMSHYATIPLILILTINLKSKLILYFGSLIMFLVLFNFGDLLLLRWPTEASEGYKSSGFGLKLIFGVILLLTNNYLTNGYKIFTWKNFLITFLMIGTLLYGPMGRYYHYYALLISFSNLFLIGQGSLRYTHYFILLSYPIFFTMTVWHEVIRFVPFVGGGVWLPYKNLIFNF